MICATRSLPYFSDRVPHHVGPVALVEVHVDVGHLLAARVQEAFEEQVVADGVEVDDPQAVGNATPGRRTSARTHPDTVLPGETDEVPYDQEVGREAHVPDDRELKVEPFHHLGGQRVPIALPRPLHGQVAQVGVRPRLVGVTGEAVGHGEFGQARFAELDLHVRPLGNEQGVVTGLRHVPEEMPHLRRRLQVVLGAVELEAVGVGQQRAGLHAEQRVVRHRVVAVGVVAVVRCEQGGVEASGDLDQLRVGPLLRGQAVVLQFDEEVVAPKDVLEPSRPPFGLRRIVRQQGLEDHPAQTSGRGDESGVMAFEQLPVEPGLVVVALEVGRRGQLHQVAVPLDGLGQQGQVVVELLPTLDVAPCVVDSPPPHRALVARLPGHVGLGADDRDDPLVAAGLVEVQDPVHVPVVRDAERRLPVGRGGGHEVAHAGRSVQHGELGVGVQMRKRPLRHRPSFRYVKLTLV